MAPFERACRHHEGEPYGVTDPTWEAASQSCRRPTEAWERPELKALGTAVRHLRLAAGLTRPQLANAAGVSATQVYRIERGTRRTRRSTLLRFSLAFCAAAPKLGDAERLVDDLVALAGNTLAPESLYERTEQRRVRRVLKAERREARFWDRWEKEVDARVVGLVS